MEALCGCHYTVPSGQGNSTTKYLPRVDVSAHTTIFSTASSTTLSQTFVNPSSTEEVSECKYLFPLLGGVSVVGFTCQIGSRIITGQVKEKTRAKEEYKEAKDRGETPGLLEQGPTSDTFITSLGNVPPGENVLVKITYIGELKHDVGADALRFTLPTRISPRYGHMNVDVPEQSLGAYAGKLAITVDINMEFSSPLQEVRSPSHPISVTLGKTSSTTTDSHSSSKASAALALETTSLEKDFILEVNYKDSGKPRAVLESHPTMKGQRALMATLVPKGPSKLSKPEVIFVADQSGSMQGARTQTLIAALMVFLKSLPVGIKFNICFFGSRHFSLFPKSQLYDQTSLGTAIDAVNRLDASCGGTETLEAVKASVESRDPNENLSLILATDGDIWQQQQLFDYLNTSVAQSKTVLRVFALGIGDSVSSSLIDGVAKAGNGFSQSVANGEKLDSKVIRMLKGALTPDSGTYTLEVQYEPDDEDFVFVERVNDSLRVLSMDEEDPPVENKESELESQAENKGLQAITNPKLLQTPQVVPPLYPFSRSTVYILMSPEAQQATPKSVVLRNNSHEDPFEIEIPVEILPQPCETIHQLAVKKAISELEEGRGWLHHAKTHSGTLLKEQTGDHFEKLVKREAIRLCVQYQIAGKYTSFVAVQSSTDESMKSDLDSTQGNTALQMEIVKQPAQSSANSSHAFFASTSGSSFSRMCATSPTPNAQFMSTRFGSAQRLECWGGGGGALPSAYAAYSMNSTSDPSQVRTYASKRVGAASPRVPMAQARAVQYPMGASSRYDPTCDAGSDEDMIDYSDEEEQGFRQESYTNVRKRHKSSDSAAGNPLQRIIALQTFEGYWELTPKLLKVVGVPAHDAQSYNNESTAKGAGTILAITFLEKKLAAEKEAWEMVVDKAKGWLASASGMEGAQKEMWKWAEGMIDGKRA